MKEILEKTLSNILKRLSRLIIWRFRPGIIGVTGSVGKTSAKIAIKTVIGAERDLRWARGNMNNELGLPLAILGNWTEEEMRVVSREEFPGRKKFEKIIFWFKVIFSGLSTFIFGRKSNYPEILVLEYGADHPQDLKKLISIVRPNISVITAVGDIPVHLEYYSGVDDVAREKSRLIECLPAAGYAVLNGDDERVMDLRDRTRANIMTFGFKEGSHVRISGFEHRSDAGEPIGVAFKLEYGGSFVPIKIDGVFGKSHAYAAAAAACVGIIFGLNLVVISERLASYKPAKSRLEIKRGRNESYIIDDSYNASVLSMQAGLHTLSDLPAKRRIAVLGDMLEIGKYATEAHERVGVMASKCVDILATVGPSAKFIAESARKAGVPKRNIHIFATVDDAKNPLSDMLKKGDLVLVKGSRAMKLDILVDEFIVKPNSSEIKES